MSEYPSTQNLYASNGLSNKGHERGPQYGFSHPSFDSISKWLVLDKLDGMNMRVVFHPYGHNDDPTDPTVGIFGRTDKAQIPGDLLSSIQDWALPVSLMTVFGYDPLWELGDDDKFAWQHKVVLYGEGVGPGIQGAAGQAYGGKKRFVLFDVKIGHKWLDWDDVVDVANKLGIETATMLGRDVDLEMAKMLAVNEDAFPEHTGLGVTYKRAYVEGGILRTDPYLFDWRGNRIMAKYKVRDL